MLSNGDVFETIVEFNLETDSEIDWVNDVVLILGDKKNVMRSFTQDIKEVGSALQSTMPGTVRRQLKFTMHGQGVHLPVFVKWKTTLYKSDVMISFRPPQLYFYAPYEHVSLTKTTEISAYVDNIISDKK